MSARETGKGPVVAIIGGGFSGAATAFHLARLLPAGAADIVVVEPREGLGYGRRPILHIASMCRRRG
ncbi:FAD-dependent oxidoreductase [Mesorhizobium amorphae]|uniref:FAD-dependent oxidoreductase n=1 Tax=Mesorhizobium amorphae TaxID=71433 RepID=UPI003F507D84